MKYVWLALLICALGQSSTAGRPDTLWSRTFGGTGDERCYDVHQTMDGGYILAGCTNSAGAGSYDFWLVKTDEKGNCLWTRTFGGTHEDYCRSVQQTKDGGYVLAGYSNSFGFGSNDFWLVKTNPDGDSLWSRTFRGENDEECQSVRQTSDGGYVLAGSIIFYGKQHCNIWMVKTDANGDSLWSHRFGGKDFDECKSVIQTADGGYVLAGSTTSFGSGYSDYWFIKTDAYGATLWSQPYGGDGIEFCSDAAQTTDGGYVLAGNRHLLDSGGCDIELVKISSNGKRLWNRRIHDDFNNYCTSIFQTNDGGFILGGYVTSGIPNGDPFTPAHFKLIKTDAEGESLWNGIYARGRSEKCQKVEQTTDGGFILGGYSAENDQGNPDFLLLKIAPQ